MRNGGAALIGVGELIQLHQRQRGVDIREIVFKARRNHLRLRRAAQGLAVISVNAEAVELQAANARGQLVIVGYHQPAFGAGHILDRME